MEKKKIEVEVTVTDGGSQFFEVWQVFYKKVSEDAPRPFMVFYSEEAARRSASKLLSGQDIESAFVWQDIVFV